MMNVEAKKNELIQWILNLSEEALIKVDKIKERDLTEEIAAYSTKGESFSQEQYANHIKGIRDRVEDGVSTYTTKEVKDFVLNYLNPGKII
jgi:hypothetical protein